MSYGASIATSFSKPFWEGVTEGQVRLQRCVACGHYQDFPQPRCRNCLGEDLDWVEAEGTGTLHSYSTVHRAPSPEFAGKVPYIVGVVRLPEGVQLLALIVAEDEASLAPDVPVRSCSVRDHGDAPVLGFIPVRVS